MTIAATPATFQERAATYMLARAHGEYTEFDIREIILPSYIDLAELLGLDPVLAVVQLIHETGNLTSWWSARPRRNPAGIGVTGRKEVQRPAAGSWQQNPSGEWAEGVAFENWTVQAIPAHVGRLLAYALTDDQASQRQRKVIQEALAFRPLPAKYRGCARTWRGLNGTWANPGRTYADKLAEIARAINHP
jgi:hypothetical protein